MDARPLNSKSTQSFARLRYIFRIAYVPYLQPLAFTTPSHFQKCTSRIPLLPQVTSHGEVPRTNQKKINFEWSQMLKFYSEKAISFIIWLLAHTMFWLHIVHILPTGTALELNQPPWRSKNPKPENINYIIEPDWDSCYF